MAKVLIVDDEGKMRAVLAMALDQEGYEVDEADSAEAALQKVPSFEPDVVVTDMRMPGMSGLELLVSLKRSYPDIECIVMTAYADAKSGIEAMRSGALEYAAKPFEMDEMLLLVRRAVEKQTLHREVDRLRLDATARFSLERIVGPSKAMQETIRQAHIVAKRATTVLIRGRSGTGKELVARGIHAESGRSKFLAVNCGALPDSLLESELFGHERGAFTGAHARKTGLFEEAGDGTIFLDEIGDISAQLQVKLLRVLQERELTRVGGTEVIKTAARVIAATNRNLEHAVAAGEFREDLYYRLSVFPIVVPSLADRVDDIPPLVDAFLLQHHHTAGLGDGVMQRLMEYSWPGNVRELENCIERAIIVAGDGPVEAGHLPEHIRENRILRPPSVIALPEEGVSLDDVEKNLIEQALDRAGGNKAQAARLLGISRRAMYSKMKTHGIAGAGSGED
ncbi:MAG: response regulator [Chitinivibrionales bacterium]|nr:response regulator [Chitinivibrionales bacterium]MBD3394431.1 response regulator [Chitinivibrionales bacterium]